VTAVNTTYSIITCWREAQRVRREMDDAYERLVRALRERPADHEGLRRTQAQADALGKRHERLCEQICRTQAESIGDVLAKLQCATGCIRDIVPEGTDPEQACDIEVRFIFAVERDIRRLIADVVARRTGTTRVAPPRSRSRWPQLPFQNR
jgi:hypothetical protein